VNIQERGVNKRRVGALKKDNHLSQRSRNSEPEKMEQEPEHLENSSAPTKPPPPIFIRVVNDYKAFCDNIKQLTNGEPFVCKSSMKGIKLSPAHQIRIVLSLNFYNPIKLLFTLIN